jgi:hypothetical protein
MEYNLHKAAVQRTLFSDKKYNTSVYMNKRALLWFTAQLKEESFSSKASEYKHLWPAKGLCTLLLSLQSSKKKKKFSKLSITSMTGGFPSYPLNFLLFVLSGTP